MDRNTQRPGPTSSVTPTPSCPPGDRPGPGFRSDIRSCQMFYHEVKTHMYFKSFRLSEMCRSGPRVEFKHVQSGNRARWRGAAAALFLGLAPGSAARGSQRNHREHRPVQQQDVFQDRPGWRNPVQRQVVSQWVGSDEHCVWDVDGHVTAPTFASLQNLTSICSWFASWARCCLCLLTHSAGTSCPFISSILSTGPLLVWFVDSVCFFFYVWRSEIFFYSSGMSMGIVASLIIVFFILARLLPKVLHSIVMNLWRS